MNTFEFAARLAQLRDEKPRRCTLGALRAVFRTAATPSEVEQINEYLRAFMAPLYEHAAGDERMVFIHVHAVVVCPCCRAHIYSANPTVDALRSTFENGMRAGEGYCATCRYPIKFLHTIPGDRSLTFPLAYHPDDIRVDHEHARYGLNAFARLQRRRELARAMGGTRWLM